MTTLSKVTVSRSWTLVYDAAIDGTFRGSFFPITMDQVSMFVGASAPSDSSSGVPVLSPIDVALSETNGDKLYARAADGAAVVALDSSVGVGTIPPWAMSSLSDSGRLNVALPPEIFDSVKAITVQPFTEANSKLGTQYEASFFNASLAASAVSDIAIVVGAQPMIVKAVNVSFNSTLLSTQIFRGGTYSGGSAIEVFNFNDEQAVPDDVTILGGITTSVIGTAVGPKIYSLGSENVGERAVSSTTQAAGVERILWPNSTYIYRIKNEDTVNASAIAGLATWYQGPLSSQTPLDQ